MRRLRLQPYTHVGAFAPRGEGPEPDEPDQGPVGVIDKAPADGVERFRPTQVQLARNSGTVSATTSEGFVGNGVRRIPDAPITSDHPPTSRASGIANELRQALDRLRAQRRRIPRDQELAGLFDAAHAGPEPRSAPRAHGRGRGRSSARCSITTSHDAEGRHGRPASIRRWRPQPRSRQYSLCPSRKGFGEGRAWVAEGSEKQGRPVYAIQTASRANSGRRTAECNVDYISPARLAPRHRDVASASRGRGLSVFARSDCSATCSCLLWSVMTIHLVNEPSVLRRWRRHAAVAVRAGRGHTGPYGRPRIVDETLEPLDFDTVQAGDIVGIGIHIGNALRGYEIGAAARARNATVVFGGIHATLYPDEADERGGAHTVVRGDGDVVWPLVIDHAARGTLQRRYEGGRIDADQFVPARWDLLPEGRYMWGSVQTVRGCPKRCSFCSVWRTDGQKPRQRAVDRVVAELVDLRRRGFRFVALADDNFYPVTLTDLAMAERQGNVARLEQLRSLRAERFELMARMAELPRDMIFFTQITMEAAEDPAFLDAMRGANIKGALVGVEGVTPEGLKDVYKGFNEVGEALVQRLRKFRERGVYILGSFIFGLPSDRLRPSRPPRTSPSAELAFAQFVALTPYPGTLDFEAWEKKVGAEAKKVAGIPVTRHWLILQADRPKVYAPHPVMTPDEIRARTQAVWDRFYSLRRVWIAPGARPRCARASPSCCCRSCIDRWPPTPVSPRTAPASIEPTAGRGSSPGRPAGCSWRDHCRTCRRFASPVRSINRRNGAGDWRVDHRQDVTLSEQLEHAQRPDLRRYAGVSVVAVAAPAPRLRAAR